MSSSEYAEVTSPQVEREDSVDTVKSESVDSTDLHVKFAAGWDEKETATSSNPTSVERKKSVKMDQQGQTNLEKKKDPAHNLSLPPPESVTWTLSGPGNSWNASVDGDAVTPDERLKWAEAFLLSCRRNNN